MADIMSYFIWSHTVIIIAWVVGLGTDAQTSKWIGVSRNIHMKIRYILAIAVPDSS